jgi:FkbM family methyltransferase
MSATAKAEGPIPGLPGDGSFYKDVRQTLRSLCPQALLNWREARFYGRYGEVELHLLQFLCQRDRDAIDVGANDGSYVHYLRRHAKRVIAFEPMPVLARALRRKFRRGVVVESMALSDGAGTVSLRMPVVDGVVVTGCSTVSSTASATYPGHRAIEVPMDRLDNVYGDDVGFIKIDVEGHELAVLRGGSGTIQREHPNVLIEVEEQHRPGALADVFGFFESAGYSGLYLLEGKLESLATFDPAIHQDARNLDSRGLRTSLYVNNFVFVPERAQSKLLH